VTGRSAGRPSKPVERLLATIVDILPSSWAAYATGAVTFISPLAGCIARVMAISGVNEYLTKIHLGVVVKNRLDSNQGCYSVTVMFVCLRGEGIFCELVLTSVLFYSRG
jgi:hypothetical protein